MSSAGVWIAAAAGGVKKKNKLRDFNPPPIPRSQQIKLADQILAEDKHAPMFKVR